MFRAGIDIGVHGMAAPPAAEDAAITVATINVATARLRAGLRGVSRVALSRLDAEAISEIGELRLDHGAAAVLPDAVEPRRQTSMAEVKSLQGKLGRLMQRHQAIEDAVDLAFDPAAQGRNRAAIARALARLPATPLHAT
jgi:hypothetical protein